MNDFPYLLEPPRRIAVQPAIKPRGLNKHLERERLDRKWTNRIPRPKLSQYP